MIEYIKKRDGSIVNFQPEKIEFAIYRALKSVNIDDFALAIKLTNQVIEKIDKEKIPTVEDIQDIVEKVLVENSLYDVAKTYILYREKRKQIRESKKILGVEDKLKLSVNAINVLKKRYLLRNEKGEIIETPEQLFKRVAKYVASCEKEKDRYEEEFFNIMSNLEFLPNSPTLMNAGTSLGQLSACFVLPVDDSIDGIFTTLKNMAIIHKSGGGTGFSFSKLRPKGDIVGSTKGIASGPISFMEIYDKATEIVKQGGKRRGANMGILSYNHPDIYEFITSKRKNILTNFNISVSVSDEFMEKVIKKEKYTLINPRNNEKVRDVYANEVFDLICQSAWEVGDPGIIYIDEINRHNPTPEIGEIESTNPCGEQPLLPYESCNLGSINLTKIIENGKINWEKLEKIIKIAIRFLDDVIDVNYYPLPEIEKITKSNRKIGLGIMGWADFLFELKIPYGSDESFVLAENLMKFINEKAFEYSVLLAREKGSFPNFEKSIYYQKVDALRNATRTTIAPTGSISIIANCSSGIEPIFGIAFIRNILEGSKFLEINPVFEKFAREKNLLISDILKEIIKTGSLKKVKGIPEEYKKIFLTALDIPPIIHLKMQSTFQKYTDNAVSKTVNLPNEATIEEVKEIFINGWNMRCKGVTVFRYGSKGQQVLSYGDISKQELEYLILQDEISSCSKGVCIY
ncbi:MAG: adenosylcobalamin-dependent ribonucleoside-diphosphate reductase [Candidatus Omnitrophica bacterium]|nr:adenosylcobalamin-dependent ribonucleoside-diphosphate reductase [Candidatus Omnitrophota bacterium]MCM8803253.1 adenosylcobalamin-dependent ribonucleoside-diphosphate reductase [Candidatus Omnitrophota bacterium]